MSLSDSIIQDINYLLKQKEWSKIRLAKEVGMTKQAVYDFMKKKTDIKLRNLLTIAKALDVHISYFFKKDDYNQNSTNILNEPVANYRTELIDEYKDRLKVADTIISKLIKDNERLWSRIETLEKLNDTK